MSIIKKKKKNTNTERIQKKIVRIKQRLEAVEEAKAGNRSYQRIFLTHLDRNIEHLNESLVYINTLVLITIQ